MDLKRVHFEYRMVLFTWYGRKVNFSQLFSIESRKSSEYLSLALGKYFACSSFCLFWKKNLNLTNCDLLIKRKLKILCYVKNCNFFIKLCKYLGRMTLVKMEALLTLDLECQLKIFFIFINKSDMFHHWGTMTRNLWKCQLVLIILKFLKSTIEILQWK